MKASFLSTGFSEDICDYKLLDNSTGNTHDPYLTINQALTEAKQQYIIFCHQDILLNKTHGYDQLIDQLEKLNAMDPNWAIAGNAGYKENLSPVVKVDDPHSFQHYQELPERVYSLDENFFVIKTSSDLRCSENLSGFHLYATDLCLQATKRNLSCYVIDFYMTHLSGGDTSSSGFQGSLVRFNQNWNQAFLFCFIRTPCTFLSLSRSSFIRWLFKEDKFVGFFIHHMGIYTRFTQVKRWLLQQRS